MAREVVLLALCAASAACGRLRFDDLGARLSDSGGDVGGAGPITLVQSTGKFEVSSGGAVVSPAFTTAPMVGDRIVVAVWTYNPSTANVAPTASDSAGNTYASDVEIVGGAGFSYASAILSTAVAQTSPSFTVTASSLAPSSIIAVALDYSHIGALDQTGSASGVVAPFVVMTTGPTQAASELAVAVINIESPAGMFTSVTPDASFTARAIELDSTGFQVGAAGDTILASAAIASCSWTSVPTGMDWNAAIATYFAGP
jgi:hypothetical protein